MPRILGIVPARGGSKGVPNKNLLKLGDRFLLGMIADAMLDSGCVDLALCSTDSEAIADVASQVGLTIPFLRPESLASDNSLVVDTVILYSPIQLYIRYLKGRPKFHITNE